jgi:hypothetical protein
VRRLVLALVVAAAFVGCVSDVLIGPPRDAGSDGPVPGDAGLDGPSFDDATSLMDGALSGDGAVFGDGALDMDATH